MTTERPSPHGRYVRTDGGRGIDEKFCGSCGEIIKQEAEICPYCGVRQRGVQHGGQQARTDEPLDRLAAAGLGGAVSFFLGWIPVAGPLLAGVLAGYLRGENRKESTLTGALANVIGSIPSVGFGVLFLGLMGIGVLAQPSPDAWAAFAFWVFVFLLGLVYYYGCGAVGGLAGAALSDRGDPTTE